MQINECASKNIQRHIGNGTISIEHRRRIHLYCRDLLDCNNECEGDIVSEGGVLSEGHCYQSDEPDRFHSIIRYFAFVKCQYHCPSPVYFEVHLFDLFTNLQSETRE